MKREMNGKALTILILLSFALLCNAFVAAAPAEKMSVQGVLKNGTTGDALSGTYSINFSLWDDPSAGSLQYTEVQSVTTDSNGLYSAVLTPTDESIFTVPLWMSLKVESDSEMSPRMNLTTSPYAYQALDVQCTNCLTGTEIDESTLDDAEVGTLTIGRACYTTGSDIDCDDSFYWNSGSDYLGVGVNPSYNLDVSGTARMTGNVTFGSPAGELGRVTIEQDSADTYPTLYVEQGANDNVAVLNARSSTYAGTILNLTTNRVSSSNHNFLKATIDADGTPATALLVRGDGNVAIGTSSPESLLHIDGADPTMIIKDIDTGYTTANAKLSFYESGASGVLDGHWDIGVFPGDLFQITDTWGASTGNRITINGSSGNVGIGTSTPPAELSVVGTTATDALHLNLSGFEGAIYGADQIYGYNDLRFYGDTSGQAIYISSADWVSIASGTGGGGTTDGAGDLHVADELEVDGTATFDSTSANTVQIVGPTSQGYSTDALSVGVDGGLNTGDTENSYGSIQIGNYWIYTDQDEVTTYDDAIQGLVIQTGDNPDVNGSYILFSVQSSGNAQRFATIHAVAGYTNQFYDSLAVGASGYTNCSAISGLGSVDCGTGSNGDLWVADDIELEGEIYVGAGAGSISDSSNDLLIDAGSGGDVIIRIG